MPKVIKTLPLLPLRGITVFPSMITHFDVGREKSLKVIQQAMQQDSELIVVTQKDTTTEDPTAEDLYTVGTIVTIKQVAKLKDPHVKVLIEGKVRAKILNINETECLIAEVEEIPDKEFEDSAESEALIRTISDVFERYAKLSSKLSPDMVYTILGAGNIGDILDLIISNITLETNKKQVILETFEIKDRMYRLVEILEEEINILEIQKNIYTKVKSKIDKSQKEYFLREQLKIITEELGEEDGLKAEVMMYSDKLEQCSIAPEIKEKISKEIERFSKIPSTSPESSVLRTYIETVLELPWNIYTEENKDIKVAKNILEKDHYGLEKIKERIIEYLAVCNFSMCSKVPILCLVGPPGVGKTSIVKSIAEATNRNYVRISLGGIRDEADIRGHRKTYVGAMPGRIINGLKQGKANNPVMLLDEIDKMAGDFRGDPAAALLEILDSAQNSAFRDHYLEVPVDLSKTLFIATANTLTTIPRPLLDRMEIIEVTSYTPLEKLEIAKKYLLPKQLRGHGLSKKQLKLGDDSIKHIIDAYTREAGVRQLERLLGNICRKVITDLLETNKKSIVVNNSKLTAYLGVPKYTYISKNQNPEIGVVRGLAWTSVGGDTLSIEVNTMPGKGQLELTGQMGDVMKESARAAMSYIRSKQDLLGLEDGFYKNKDIHIHIPEGAVPKDGPSAGITMATAILSALTKRPVRDDIAMTGEITIRGRVLPIGGLKEKLLAAKRAGISLVIIPKQNKHNVGELEENILEGLEIKYAETMEDVLKSVFA